MAQTVGAHILDRLHEHGIRRVYGYPGDGINGILATAAARSGTELGPLPAGGLGSVRAPGVGSHVVEEITPADDDLLDVGRRAGQVLDGWASAGLGDPVDAAEETVRAAAGPPANRAS